MRRKRNRSLETVTQRQRRALRRRLGFCWHCLQPALPGGATCAAHLPMSNKWSMARRERKYKKRGWRMARVKV